MSAESLVRHVRECDTCRPAFSFNSMCSTGQTIRVKIETTVTDSDRLRGNDLVTLQEIIKRDPSIPSAWMRINRATGKIEMVTEGQIVDHAPIWR